MAFLLDPLMQTLGSEADNLSFLLQMTETILGGHYRDATDASESAARRLHQVVRACGHVFFHLLVMHAQVHAAVHTRRENERGLNPPSIPPSIPHSDASLPRPAAGPDQDAGEPAGGVHARQRPHLLAYLA